MTCLTVHGTVAVMSRITKSTSLDEFVSEAKRLRALADTALGEFLSYLYEAERTPVLWRDSGYTFVQFLKQANIIEPSRYMAYKSVHENLGARATQGVGVHAVVAAGRLNDADQQRELLTQARAWEKTNGTSISAQTAKSLVDAQKSRAIGFRTGNKRYETLVRDLDLAQAEVDRLHAENDALRAENETLRAEVETLRGGATPVARPARRARVTKVAA